jgi:hypothetical protein
MRRERALKIVLVVVGLLLTAGVVPLTMFFSREPAVPMLMSIFVIDETFTLELLELLHPHEIQRNLPTGGWRKVSLRILIALLGSGVVRVAEES